MNLYELFSLFWRDNGYRAFSKTETILYFYLLTLVSGEKISDKVLFIKYQ